MSSSPDPLPGAPPGAPSPFAIDGAWPTLCGGPAAPARLGDAAEDFVVDELPAYPCSGQGEHLFVRVQKRDISTMQVVHDLARLCGLPEQEIGFAGRKDQRGLTSQWFSVPRRCEGRLRELESDTLKVLEVGLHGNKLRLGHLAGNHFKLIIKTAEKTALDQVRSRLETIQRRGLPDYYGPQRFGPGLASASEGLRALEDGRLKLRGRRGEFLISAAQSLLFNDLLGQRLKRGWLFVALLGDLLKTRRGGLFTCTDPAQDTPRVEAGEVVPTGPMFGRKMMPVCDAALTLESEILQARGLSPDHFWAMRPPIPGTRRALLARVSDAHCEQQGDDLALEFTLPPGSYASILCRELFGFPFEW